MEAGFDCLTFDVTRMAGDDLGPENPPANLTGDVSFDMGSGCGTFDYGYAKGSNAVSVPGVSNVASVGKCTARASAYRGTPRAKHSGRGVRFTVRAEDEQGPLPRRRHEGGGHAARCCASSGWSSASPTAARRSPGTGAAAG